MALSIINFIHFFSTYEVSWGQVLWLGLTEIKNSLSFERPSTSTHSKVQGKPCKSWKMSNSLKCFCWWCIPPLFVKADFVTKLKAKAYKSLKPRYFGIKEKKNPTQINQVQNSWLVIFLTAKVAATPSPQLSCLPRCSPVLLRAAAAPALPAFPDVQLPNAEPGSPAVLAKPEENKIPSR